MEERFKYGSIGSEDQQGMPFWIFIVLPKMFPEHLPRPGGWTAVGLSWEQGRELPVGISKRHIGFDRVAINCAFCHLGRVRRADEAVPRIYPAGPGNAIDPLAYQRFLFACANDPRFTGANFVTAISEITRLSFLDRLLYRYLLVPQTRKALLQTDAGFAWTNKRVDWGKGRIDPFNPIKYGILLRTAYGDKSIEEIDDGTVGNSDMQPIWNMRPRVERKMSLHWDGLNTDITEVVLSSALGDGAAMKSLPLEPLKRIEEFLIALPSPRFEDVFPGQVNKGLAASGEPIFREHCARCHAMDGERTGQVMPLTDEAWSEGVDAAAPRPRFTDNHRALMWTPQAATAYNTYTEDYAWDFDNFRALQGYVNVPLDGLWSARPLPPQRLGAVPGRVVRDTGQAHEVLLPRPRRLRPARMGFVSEGEEAQRVGTPYDTAAEGNGNQGHFWGIDPARQKAALVEYLKTL